MMRIVMLAGTLAAIAYAANAQEVGGNPEVGRMYAREACSPRHAVTAEQRSQRNYRYRTRFPDHRQYLRNDGDCPSRLSADAASEDAEPDPVAGAIGQCDQLRAQLARPPTTGSKTLNLI